MANRAGELVKPPIRHRTVLSGLNTHRVLVASLFVAVFAMVATRPQPADTDTWWHLKSGQVIWETGRLLRADAFSHTASGQPWINHSWLVQVVLWPVYRAAGLAGMGLLLAASLTAAFALAYRQCEGGPIIAVFATLLAVLASTPVWAIRPQIVSLVLTALIASLLNRYSKTGNTRHLWPIPLLIALWANCHAGFVVAFILIGCTLAGETLNGVTGSSDAASRPKPIALAWVLLASVPAVVLNPNTVRLIPYALQTVSIGPLQDFIQEWAAPNFHRLQFHPFIWLLLLTLAAMAVSRLRVDWTELVLIGVFGYMGLLAVRNMALFALIVAPILARHTTAAVNELALVPRLSWLGWLARTRPSRPSPAVALLNAFLLALIVMGAAMATGVNLSRVRDPTVWGRGLPVQAAEYLREHRLPGEMFNTYNWGGYLIWTLYPETRVFVDGRTDLYAFAGVLDDYVWVHLARPGWREVLQKYGVGYVVTEQGGLLATVMDEAEDWQAVYQDGLAAIYVPTGVPRARVP